MQGVRVATLGLVVAIRTTQVTGHVEVTEEVAELVELGVLEEELFL